MTDVLIIGGGLAGWRAAEAAVARGCSVTLVANGPGNSPDVHALNCPVRDDDSVARYIEDTMSSGKGANDPALVRVMCERSLDLKREFAFDRESAVCGSPRAAAYQALQPVGSTIPRCVSIDHAIGAVALNRIRERLAGNVSVIKATVKSVVSGPQTEARWFTVELEGESVELKARALVLATGGWCGKYDFSTNPKYLRGDGIVFARALGGAVRDVDGEHVQYEPTVRVEGPRRGVPVITTLLHEGAKLLTPDGRAFLPDARLDKDELSRAIFAIGGRALYDLRACSEASLRRCRMDPAERMILVAPAAHSSLGGVVIDDHCRVLAAGAGAEVVPGLFACGEVTAGVHGLNRLGGNGGTAAMVFGTLAGESAAEFVKGVR